MVCWNCEKPGHMKSECRAPRKDKEGRTANATTEDTVDALLLSVRSSLDDWIVDSGASFHSCSSRDIMEPYTAGTLYTASGSSSNILLAEAVSQSHLWHSRLGHMSEKGMKVLKSRGLLPELESVNVGLCEQCLLGKQKRVSFITTGRAPKTEKLELVHTDLWGPSPVTSLGGPMYYMTFIDDCTRKVWVYFLKRKSEAFDAFRRWRALVEKETGLEVKCLRSDNGGEYNSEAIKEYCADHGIRMQKMVPGTPQQNGIAERMNRTLNEPDSVGAQIDEIERTEEEAEPESDEPIAESSTPLALGREPRMRRAPDRFGNSFIILLLYVDDMLIAGSDVKEIERLKGQLSRRFDMKDLGEARQILGMTITRDRNAGKLWLSQSDYIEKVLCRFKMDTAKPVGVPLGSQIKLSNKDSPKDDSEKERMRVTPYASAIGSLMYAMEAIKWILRYLRGTKDRALVFGRGTITLSGFVDADFAGSDLDKRRSTTGYVFTYGGTAVSWISKLQKIVTLSTTEAEYVAVTEAAKELVWLQNFLNELGRPQEDVALYSDSQSAIHLAKNPAFHSRMKHIEVKYHFIWQLLEKKMLQLKKIRGDRNPADMLTKAECVTNVDNFFLVWQKCPETC
ncbi:cysteine-rich RLK (RECEPTOR-like protein kinase) 8 [Striga hermonthica]|uniref:Cysteine-rich RLK (RECEPTOR-like protein kinase) 8 n=1 Tax=Striga hermonthica TaxID=68872 RepID=A0A9N7MXY3_STRHE|nr:cysteine-rich RLK (RECEPTOR-like protein kinase) 8 [Striga hermonthica]